MARSPIQEQGRFGPAESRARVFSAFVQPKQADMSAADAAGKVSGMLGQAADFQLEREVEDAEKQREQGLQDYVSGLVQDGKRIVDGEMQPIESEFYMAGVEMGRGRRRGRQVWNAFSEWAAENPRPGIGDETSYEEWIEQGLAASQESTGVDPDRLTELEMSEYAGVIDQVRQRDFEQQNGHINRQVLEENQASWESDVEAVRIEFDPTDENAQSDLYTTAQNLMARGRAMGLDTQGMRRSLLTQFTNIAEAAGDTSVLENMPNGVLKDPQIEAARRDAIDRLESQFEAEQYENEIEQLGPIQEMLQDGRIDEAQIALDGAKEAGMIREETHLAWDQRIFNEGRQARERARNAARDRLQGSARDRALQDAQAGGTLAAGVDWVDPVTGDFMEMSPDEVATRISTSVFETMGRGPEAMAHLTNIGERSGLLFSALQSYLQRPLAISAERLADPESLLPAQVAQIEFMLNANPTTLSSYITNPEDMAVVSTLRTLYQSGAYGREPEDGFAPARALAAARGIQGVVPRQGVINGFHHMFRDRLDDESQSFWPLFQRSNLDSDNPATMQWANERANIAARIQESQGRDAAVEYMRGSVADTLVVNRRPVPAIGNIRGREGSVFMENVLTTVVKDKLLDDLRATYEPGFLSVVLGLQGDSDPLSMEFRSAASANVDMIRESNGVRFVLEDADVYMTDQELLGLHSVWQQERQENQISEEQEREDQALEDSREPGLSQRAVDWLASQNEEWADLASRFDPG